jgi:hypothetical protein
LAVRNAEDHELPQLRGLANNLTVVKRDLDGLVLEAPPTTLNCEAEIAEARSDLMQKLYKEFRHRLEPVEFSKVRAIVRTVTGEEPL